MRSCILHGDYGGSSAAPAATLCATFGNSSTPGTKRLPSAQLMSASARQPQHSEAGSRRPSTVACHTAPVRFSVGHSAICAHR